MEPIKKSVTFIQISDIHLTTTQHSKTTYMFKHFLHTIVPKINPDFVICSGDECNSVNTNNSTNYPIKEEWELYSKCLKETNMFHPNKWLDIRGNHDEWDESNSYNTYYKQHSVYGCFNKGPIYQYHIPYNGTQLCVIGFEGCEEIEWCFFGTIPSSILTTLEEMLENNKEYPIILFCHFPLFTIDEHSKSKMNHTLSDLISIYKPIAYLSGHIHSQLGKHTNYIMNNSTQCLTVNDFKERGCYRLFTFANNILTFQDYYVDDDHNQPIASFTFPNISHEIDEYSTNNKIHENQNILISTYCRYPLKSITFTMNSIPISLKQSEKDSSIYKVSLCNISPNTIQNCQLSMIDIKKNKTIIKTKFNTQTNTILFPNTFTTFLMQIPFYKYTFYISLICPLILMLITLFSFAYSSYLYKSLLHINLISSKTMNIMNTFNTFFNTYISNSILSSLVSKWFIFHHDPVVISTYFIFYYVYYMLPLREKHLNGTICLYYWWGNYNITKHSREFLVDNQLWSPICLFYQLILLDLYFICFYPFSTYEIDIIPFLLQILYCVPIFLLTSIFKNKRSVWEPSDFLCTYTDEYRPYLMLLLCILNMFKYHC